MSILIFQSYSFYSLPGASYLFFPAFEATAADPAARMRAALNVAATPKRVIVSSELRDGEARPSGTAADDTLYVSLDAPSFLELLREVSDPERNFRLEAVAFKFELDEEDTLIDYAHLTRFRPPRRDDSPPEGADSAERTARKSDRVPTAKAESKALADSKATSK